MTPNEPIIRELYDEMNKGQDAFVAAFRKLVADVAAHKDVGRRWIEALNAGNLDALDQLATPDYVYHGSGYDLQGIGELKAFVRYLLATFPDMKFIVNRVIVEGDLMAMHFTLTGTQERDFMGMPPRGGRLDLPVLTMSRLRDGRIAEDWEAYDSAEMMRQLEAAVVTV
ncbi:MAG: ester cyclase [Bacteroidales bacterium]